MHVTNVDDPPFNKDFPIDLSSINPQSIFYKIDVLTQNLEESDKRVKKLGHKNKLLYQELTVKNKECISLKMDLQSSTETNVKLENKISEIALTISNNEEIILKLKSELIAMKSIHLSNLSKLEGHLQGLNLYYEKLNNLKDDIIYDKFKFQIEAVNNDVSNDVDYMWYLIQEKQELIRQGFMSCLTNSKSSKFIKIGENNNEPMNFEYNNGELIAYVEELENKQHEQNLFSEKLISELQDHIETLDKFIVAQHLKFENVIESKNKDLFVLKNENNEFRDNVGLLKQELDQTVNLKNDFQEKYTKISEEYHNQIQQNKTKVFNDACIEQLKNYELISQTKNIFISKLRNAAHSQFNANVGNIEQHQDALTQQKSNDSAKKEKKINDLFEELFFLIENECKENSLLNDSNEETNFFENLTNLIDTKDKTTTESVDSSNTGICKKNLKIILPVLEKINLLMTCLHEALGEDIDCFKKFEEQEKKKNIQLLKLKDAVPNKPLDKYNDIIEKMNPLLNDITKQETLWMKLMEILNNNKIKKSCMQGKFSVLWAQDVANDATNFNETASNGTYKKKFIDFIESINEKKNSENCLISKIENYGANLLFGKKDFQEIEEDLFYILIEYSAIIQNLQNKVTQMSKNLQLKNETLSINSVFPPETDIGIDKSNKLNPINFANDQDQTIVSSVGANEEIKNDNLQICQENQATKHFDISDSSMPNTQPGHEDLSGTLNNEDLKAQKSSKIQHKIKEKTQFGTKLTINQNSSQNYDSCCQTDYERNGYIGLNYDIEKNAEHMKELTEELEAQKKSKC